LLLFKALTNPNKKIPKRSQGDKKNALPPHPAARFEADPSDNEQLSCSEMTGFRV
jgi:hypothetical protein